MRIGLIGSGAIGHFLLDKINHSNSDTLQINSVFVRNRKKHASLETDYSVALYTNFDEFLSSPIDIIIEAAHVEAVKSYLPKAIRKKDTMIISVGALSNIEFLQEVLNLAMRHGNNVYLPTGAIGGLDLIQNAGVLGKIESVSLTTRKPAQSLTTKDVQREVIIFNGKAADAIQQFPKNINVSIVLALAGIGIDNTSVTIIADPQALKNKHMIKVKGDFGEACFSIENNPLPDNPKTSYLAAMSILGTLKRMQHRIKIG